MKHYPRTHLLQSTIWLVGLLLCPATSLQADNTTEPKSPLIQVPDVVLESQRKRIQIVNRVTPSVVAIYNTEQRGGGSGILIDEKGFGITNYHVVASMLGSRSGFGGLSEGKRYHLRVLGVDPIGDVAMFQLSGRDTFPVSPMGDSDLVRVGDTALALGNPFSLTEDEMPTLSLGLVTGVHRYQWGVKGNLTYSDCIQIDAPINPGNSGGPLFNELGDVIGINGRISINTRGRFNVGFGYAITSNQIRRFMPLLRAGGLAQHGSFEATVEENRHLAVIDKIRSAGPAYRAGLRRGDRILAIDNTPIKSSNHFVSIIGTYPGYWNLLVDFEHRGRLGRTVVSLRPVAPRLRSPYTPDGQANGREVNRVISMFRKSVGIKTEDVISTKYQWHACRTYDDKMRETWKTIDDYDVQATDEGALLLQEYDEDGQPARLVEIDAQQIQILDHDDRQGSDVRSFERRVLSVLHLVYQRLFQPADPLNMLPLDHGGANVDYRLDNFSHAPVDILFTDEINGIGIVSSDVDELISPLENDAVVRLAFDTKSHELRRATIWHQQAGTLGTLYFSDYQAVVGVRLPHTIHVRGQGYMFADIMSDWKVLK